MHWPAPCLQPSLFMMVWHIEVQRTTRSAQLPILFFLWLVEGVWFAFTNYWLFFWWEKKNPLYSDMTEESLPQKMSLIWEDKFLFVISGAYEANILPNICGFIKLFPVMSCATFVEKLCKEHNWITLETASINIFGFYSQKHYFWSFIQDWWLYEWHKIYKWPSTDADSLICRFFIE